MVGTKIMTRTHYVTAAFQRYAPNNSKTYDANIAAFPLSRRITLSRHSANEWTSALVGKFNQLTALRLGWDGYTGRPVSFTCAMFAAQLIERLFDEAIPPPSLVPGSDGTLQFEWHMNGYDVEVDVLGDYNVIATRYDCLDGTEEELELDTDFTALAGWISELKVDRLAGPVALVA